MFGAYVFRDEGLYQEVTPLDHATILNHIQSLYDSRWSTLVSISSKCSRTVFLWLEMKDFKKRWHCSSIILYLCLTDGYVFRDEGLYQEGTPLDHAILMYVWCLCVTRWRTLLSILSKCTQLVLIWPEMKEFRKRWHCSPIILYLCMPGACVFRDEGL